MSIQQAIDLLKENGYVVSKKKPKSGIKKSREDHNGPKPKRNTFESRYKRWGKMIDNESELLKMCFTYKLKNRQGATFIS